MSMSNILDLANLFIFSVTLLDDLRQVNDKLVEAGTSKIALQMKLDELEAAELSIKVRPFLFKIKSNYVLSFLGSPCKNLPL